jgi:hypothetical protein
MDAPAAVRNVAWPDASAPIVRQLLRATSGTLVALVALAALLVFERRIAGALSQPLPALTLAALSAGLAASSLAFRHVLRRPGDRTTPRAIALHAAPTLVLTLLAIGLLVPGTTVAAWASFLGVLLVEEGWSWGRMFPREAVSQATRSESTLPGNVDPRPTSASLDERPGGPAALLDEPDVSDVGADDENATQWVVRRRDPDAGEVIEGWVKCGFEPGQRHTTAHLAICPPLAATPVCYAEASDGPSCQVKVAQALPYGVRLEIKLDRTAEEPCEVLVEFSMHERAGE